MGTENLLGRYLGQLTTPDAVRRTSKTASSLRSTWAGPATKYFLLMISAGFDAEVIRSLHENRRGNIRRAAYFLPTLRAIRSYEYPPMRLYWDDRRRDRTAAALCRWLFGFNLPLYALGLPIAPDAVGTDGLLDVCTFERGAVWSVARYLWHVVRKMHLTLPDAGLPAAEQFRLEPTTATQRCVPTRWRLRRHAAGGRRSACPANCGCWSPAKRPAASGFQAAAICQSLTTDSSIARLTDAATRNSSHECITVPNNPAQIGPYRCGSGEKLLVIAGPCVIESESLTLAIAERLAIVTRDLPVQLVFKASFERPTAPA